MIFFNKTKTLSLSFLFFTLLQTSFSLLSETIEIAQEKDLAEIFQSKHDTIIMASMNHCSWCIKTKPYFTQLAEQYTSKIKFYSINGPQSKLQQFLLDFTQDGNHIKHDMINVCKKRGCLGINNTLHIPGYPIFLYLIHGKIIDIHIGGCDLETLEKFIKKNHK